MVQRIDEPPDPNASFDSSDDDERVGEAIEAYLALAEQGHPPAIDEFAARYPDLKDDVRAGLEGLELVHGLLGIGSAHGSGSGQGPGLHHRIESGQRIAGYRVVRELGRGGMGTVYEAVHVGLERPVALKVLGVHAAPDSSARRRFLNEARTAAALHHTHIVPVFDVGQVGGLCYYAMQRIEGSGLDLVVRHLRRSRPLIAGGGGGPASGRFLSNDPQGNSGISSINARLGHLWIRVSTGWLRRHDRRPGIGNGAAGSPGLTPLSPQSQADAITGSFAHSGLDDSTASWGNASRQTRFHASGIQKNLATAAIVSASQGGHTALDLPPRRPIDEPVPFDPPRGSAYFRWVAEVGLQSADALAHAHHQGVIHRDVKPSNLLIDEKGNIWVTDFGLARRLADPGLTHHDSLLGTPRYMSPEQARTGSIDGRTDVYSLGATLYELLTLRPPFDGRSAAELIDQIGQIEPTAPSAVDSRIPRDLETIVLKTLAKRPADRYASAAELAEDLARFLNHEPVKARRISVAGRLWRVARRHPGITTVSTAAAAAILAVATFAYVRVVAERDDANRARGKTEQALDQAKDAIRNERTAMKEALVKSVEIVAQSANPNRRRQGLDLIQKTVALEPGPDLRAQLRDEAVKFLVLRDVETRPELATSHAQGLVSGRNGHRLAVLSDDHEEVSFWSLDRRQRQSTYSLRTGTSTASGAPIAALGEPAGDERVEPGAGAGLPSGANVTVGRTGGTASASTGAATVTARRFGSRRLALAGNYVAALLPDDSGVRLIDSLSGAPFRTLPRKGSSVVGVLGDPGGRRLVTIETESDEALIALMEELPDWDPLEFHGSYLVNIWDPDHLDAPITLPWSLPPGPPPRPPTTTGSGTGSGPAPGFAAGTSSQSVWPLVAISPDGNTVAVGPWNGTWVRVFSAEDGKPRRGRSSFIPNQTQLSALALGPNAMLATAGRGTVRLYDLDNVTFPTSLTPTQSVTWLMRFSPQGNLLALAGLGRIELWDPVAHSLVNLLPNSEQANDVAFAPDGRSLAAVGRAGGTFVWDVIDSATRIQLSGFDARPSSLAFSADGVLAGGGSDGAIWFWRDGRCPEIGTAWPQPLSGKSGPEQLVGRPSQASRENGARRGAPPERGRTTRGRESSPEPERPTSLAFDAQGRLIAHNMQGLNIWAADAISTQTPPMSQTPLPPAPGSWFNVTPMAKTVDGQTIVLVRSSSVLVWNADSPDRLIPVLPPSHSGAEPVLALPGGQRRTANAGSEVATLRYRAVQVAPRGDRIYLIDQNGQLHAWAISGIADQTLAQVQARALDWVVPLAEGASSLALRPDGGILAIGDRAGTVTLFDTVRNRVVERIKPSNGEAESLLLALAFSPDGQSLAVGSQQGTISLWSVAQPTKPRLRLRLPGHRGLVTNLVFDHQGHRLASAAGIEPLVEVWNLELLQRELARLSLAE